MTDKTFESMKTMHEVMKKVVLTAVKVEKAAVIQSNLEYYSVSVEVFQELKRSLDECQATMEALIAS
jgi:predicted secreted Zn-dependent protease